MVPFITFFFSFPDFKRIIHLARNEEVYFFYRYVYKSLHLFIIYSCRTVLLCAILQVESIVLKRYGRDAYRMFRHLLKENQFRPTDQVITLIDEIVKH